MTITGGRDDYSRRKGGLFQEEGKTIPGGREDYSRRNGGLLKEDRKTILREKKEYSSRSSTCKLVTHCKAYIENLL